VTVAAKHIPVIFRCFYDFCSDKKLRDILPLIFWTLY